MAIGVLSKLSWSADYLTHSGVARQLGVTRPTVTRYLTGIREIPEWRLHQIDLMYNRTQYGQFRIRGLSPQTAARYRGLSPEASTTWIDRLETVVDKFAGGVAKSRAKGAGLDWDEMSESERDYWMYDADRAVREGLERSPEDIESFEEGIT